MSETSTRPIPVIDQLYAPYYLGLKERKILVQKCTACGHIQWPPRDFCFGCHANQLTWTEVPQVGKVYTYSVYYRAFHPWFKQHLPMAAVVADLGEGVRILGNYLGNVEEIVCDMEVKAVFEDVNKEITLLHWETA
jgi:uncharacterized OB-fold protein